MKDNEFCYNSIMKTKNIEIEFRSMFGKTKYLGLMKFLGENGEDLGEDDRDTYFFIFEDKLLKVVKYLTKKSGKISLKLNRIGKGSDFEEIEIPFSFDVVD